LRIHPGKAEGAAQGLFGGSALFTEPFPVDAAGRLFSLNLGRFGQGFIRLFKPGRATCVRNIRT